MSPYLTIFINDVVIRANNTSEAGAALKPDSQKTYLEQAGDAISGKADVSLAYLTYISIVYLY